MSGHRESTSHLPAHFLTQVLTPRQAFGFPNYQSETCPTNRLALSDEKLQKKTNALYVATSCRPEVLAVTKPHVKNT